MRSNTVFLFSPDDYKVADNAGNELDAMNKGKVQPEEALKEKEGVIILKKNLPTLLFKNKPMLELSQLFRGVFPFEIFMNCRLCQFSKNCCEVRNNINQFFNCAVCMPTLLFETS